jgi:hypothetical protein
MRAAELEDKNRLAGSGETGINALEERQDGGCCRSTKLGIVAPRASWREIFLWKAGDRHKKRKDGQNNNPE